MNNAHDIGWKQRAIFTKRRPVPWKLLLIGYALLAIAAFMAGVWIGPTP